MQLDDNISPYNDIVNNDTYIWVILQPFHTYLQFNEKFVLDLY